MSTVASLTVADAVDAYMSRYCGRDPARSHRLSSFADMLGPDRPLADVTDDHVFATLKNLEEQPARYYAGKDADGMAIYKSRGPRTGATVNRFRQAFASLCTWAIHERLVPKGWVHPCKGIQARREHPGVVRFLDDDERTRLLTAVRKSSWERLYVLVLLALTSGARRGAASWSG